MKVYIQGQGLVSLTNNEFLASGGEGSVYAVGNIAVKIYTDPTRALPVGKITELARITDPHIIKPESVVEDVSHKPVGYTMKLVRDTHPLCQTFTRAFREREGLDQVRMLNLTQQIQHLVEHTHKAGILIVDLNEMNYILSSDYKTVFAIDVDSYQTPNYKATAIMASVKDWSVSGNNFTEGSDWFSFACVAFQMLTAIHPYKGKHPTVQGLEQRMQKGISVFDPKVTVPKMVYPFDQIPRGYLAWFKSIFVDGKRLPPPKDPGGVLVVQTAPRTTMPTGIVESTLLFTLEEDILFYQDGCSIFQKGFYIQQRKFDAEGPFLVVGLTPQHKHPFVVGVSGSRLVVHVAGVRVKNPPPIDVKSVMSCAGRVYFHSGNTIQELVSFEGNTDQTSLDRIVWGTEQVASAHPNTTKLFPGVAFQDLLGETQVVVFPEPGTAYQVAIPLLNRNPVIDARFCGRVLMVHHVSPSGPLRSVFLFREDGSGFDLVSQGDDLSLNFIRLDGGVVVHLLNDDSLEVWTESRPGAVRKISEPGLPGGANLVQVGGRAGYFTEKSLFSMRMK